MTNHYGVLKGAWDEFRLPAWLNAPSWATDELRAAWDAEHVELGGQTSTESLEQSISRLLKVLEDGEPAVVHRRFVFLALALALAAKATFDLYNSRDEAPRASLAAVRAWLRGNTAVGPDAVTDLADEEMSAYLDRDDAMSLYFELGRSLKFTQAASALRTMIDDALAGEAVTSYRDDRRAIYNWLITDAIPSAYAEREPLCLPTRAGVVENPKL